MVWCLVGVVCCVVGLGYTYVGYPVLIWVASRWMGHGIKPKKPEEWPTVSVVMAVHNEELNVEAKLSNLLALRYPSEKLQIIVVSDGSTDRTEERVRGFAGVELVCIPEASGKPNALNEGMRLAMGDLVLFCDVRQRVSLNTLESLVSWFSDASVGAVSGELVLDSEKGPGVYWKYERMIRAAEGRFRSVVGATGALYMIRRSLYTPLPVSCLLDDVLTPMRIVCDGFRVLFDDGAKAYDQEMEVEREFRRKTRTLAGNFQLLEWLPGLFSPKKNPLFFEFFSHKWMRLMCPYLLVLCLVFSALLAWRVPVGWSLGWLGLQCFFYGLALGSWVSGGGFGKLGRFSLTFVTLNIAAVVGFWRYLRRDFRWTGKKK